MKIAVFHELPSGGARIATNMIAQGLKRKHEVDLYYVDDKKSSDEESFYTNVYFYKFIPKFWNGKNWKARLYKDTIELYKLSQLHKQIAEEIRNKSYDLVFVNASKYIESPFLLKFPNKKKFFYLHDPHYRALYETSLTKKRTAGISRQIYETLNHLLRKILDRQNLYRADVFLANSEFTQKIFAKTYGRESVLAYLGVDATFFSPKEMKKEFDILYIGSREQIDGYKLLLESLPYMKIKPKVRTIFFEEEWLSKTEMRDLYRKSEIVVCLAYNEPFGLIPLEAMSCGVPVIAVNEGGYKETVIDNETGYLIKRNPKLLAQKISFLLVKSKIVSKMGNNARQYIIKKWTWEQSVKNLEKLFSSHLAL